MSNRGLAERHIDASNRRATAEIESTLSDDVVWDMTRSISPMRGLYRGEEVRGLLESYIEAFESVVATPLEFYERGDWMAIDIQVTMRGAGSGAEVQARGARVYEFRDGKIARFIQFQNMDDAREFVDAQP